MWTPVPAAAKPRLSRSLREQADRCSRYFAWYQTVTSRAPNIDWASSRVHFGSGSTLWRASPGDGSDSEAGLDQKGDHGYPAHGAVDERRPRGRRTRQEDGCRSVPDPDRDGPSAGRQDRDDLHGRRHPLRPDRGLRPVAHQAVRRRAARGQPGHRPRPVQLPGLRPARPRLHLEGAARHRPEHRRRPPRRVVLRRPHLAVRGHRLHRRRHPHRRRRRPARRLQPRLARPGHQLLHRRVPVAAVHPGRPGRRADPREPVRPAARQAGVLAVRLAAPGARRCSAG